MHDTDGHAASCTRLTNGARLARKASGYSPAAAEYSGKSAEESNLSLVGSQCALCFLSPCVPVQGGLLKADVDFSNYDVPLFEQIVQPHQGQGCSALGRGREHTGPLFYCCLSLTNDRWNNPQFSHSFISVIRVLGDGKQPGLTSGLRRGDSRTEILKHSPSVGCLTILILIRTCAFSSELRQPR
mgnify:CR=1 FL=1